MTPEVGRFLMRAAYKYGGVYAEFYLIIRLTPKGMWLKRYHMTLSRAFDATLKNELILTDLLQKDLDPLEQLAELQEALRQTSTCTWRSRDTWFASVEWKEAVDHLHARRVRYIQHAKRRLKDAEKSCANVEHYMAQHFGEVPARSTERTGLFQAWD